MSAQTTDPCFTVAQAEARLPLVRRIVRDAMLMYQQISETRARLDEMKARRSGKTGLDIYAEEWKAIELDLELDQERLQGYVAELAQLGVDAIDHQQGFVSFPSRRGGKAIILSWKYDEPTVEYWHEVGQTSEKRVLLESRGRDLGDSGVNRVESRFDETV